MLMAQDIKQNEGLFALPLTAVPKVISESSGGESTVCLSMFMRCMQVNQLIRKDTLMIGHPEMREGAAFDQIDGPQLYHLQALRQRFLLSLVTIESCLILNQYITPSSPCLY